MARVTVKLPAEAYVCDGFWLVEVLLVPELGSPKVQFHPEGLPVELSWKTVGLLKQTEAAVKVAVPVPATVTVWVNVPLQPLLSAVTVTV